MRYKTQDPKFDIEVIGDEAYLINAFTGVRIPKDEPVFIFRAKDTKALPALRYYQMRCASASHREAVGLRIESFSEFADFKSDIMKEPDTVPWD